MKTETSNLTRYNASITQEKRNRLNGHGSIVVWFTGLSGSGKSTLAHLVEEKLYELNYRTFVLDGDNIRHGLSSDLTFSDDDRMENIRRVGEIAKLMMEAGVIVMTAFISPFEHDRNLVRQLLPKGNFVEVYCKASLETCESRDVKELYRRARAGEIKNYTGIDSPYEIPINPDLIIDTEHELPENSVIKLIDFLKLKGVIK